MALSQKVIKSGADVYYDPSFTGTILSNSLTTTVEADAAVTALEAISWEDMGLVTDVSVGLSIANAQDLNVLNCGQGTVSTLVDRGGVLTPTLLEVKNFELWSQLLGGTSLTDATTKSEYYQQNVEQIEIPQGRFRVVSCPYQTGISTSGQQWARDYYYVEKATLDGELTVTFLKKGELPTGSQFALNVKDGGSIFVHTKYGATEASLA